MKNSEKYTTPESRAKAFMRFYTDEPVMLSQPALVSHVMEWLDMETLNILPCPFCGADVRLDASATGYCCTCPCGYRSKIYTLRERAVAGHNRVAQIVHESYQYAD